MIHLIVGNTGAGKTTYATELKQKTSGVLFSIDHWNNTLFINDKKPDDGLDWFLERIDRAEKVIMGLVQQLETLNTDTILDLGFSKQQHREKFIKFAKAYNFDTKMHFLEVSKETRLARVLQRNSKKGASFEFEVSKTDFDFMEGWFEKPSKEELIGAVILTK